jgi:hypothetical protein
MDPSGWILTQWSPSSEAVLRTGYGTLLLLQLLMTARQAKRFFVSERFGGYLESTPWRDAILRPPIARAIITVWILAALCILNGTYLLAATLLHFALCRYFFVRTRWQGILRGMGAPGQMNHWLSALMLLLAISHYVDPHGLLRAATVLTFRIDYAAMMFMAGLYKLTAGYARGDGFERGLVNPWWGFWARWLGRVHPTSVVFRFLDHSAWIAELVCAALFLVVPAAPFAALFFAGSFLAIAAVIRLTFLAEMVALCCMLYVYPGSFFDGWLSSVVHMGSQAPVSSSSPVGDVVAYALVATMAVYVACLPFAYAGMSLNFYFKKRLPPWLQLILDRWTRFFGLILWRVFTADVINFYTRIRLRAPGEDAGRDYLLMRAWDGGSEWRYMHVGEFICLASIFTTLKYYPTNKALFEARIVRYARSLPIPSGGDVVFDYHSVIKGPDAFQFPLVARFTVDAERATVVEETLDPLVDVRAPAEVSPVSPGVTPGSYAPAPVLRNASSNTRAETG